MASHTENHGKLENLSREEGGGGKGGTKKRKRRKRKRGRKRRHFIVPNDKLCVFFSRSHNV